MAFAKYSQVGYFCKTFVTIGTSFACLILKTASPFMNIYKWGLLILLVSCNTIAFGQKLKKADRLIVANLKSHISNLSKGDSTGVKAGSEAEREAAEYISRQFARYGLKPMGDGNSWYQKFSVYDGKEILPATSLSLNGKKLKLYEEYFPLPFSANKHADAAVAVALAEDGVPWFKELREVLGDDGETVITDTVDRIRKKAEAAADKGASALVIYNGSDQADYQYDRLDSSADVSIPVVYITREAFKKYTADESEIIDIALNVAKKKNSRTGMNVIGYADNKADSTIIAEANLSGDSSVAALLEVARLTKANKARRKNYLFVAYCGEQNGAAGASYFKQHPAVAKDKISRVVALDSVKITDNNPNGLHLVRQSVELIK